MLPATKLLIRTRGDAGPLHPTVPSGQPLRADRRDPHGYRISVLLPCYNEQETICRVIEDFRRVLPEAVIYVYDNNSTDQSVTAARTAGAGIRSEKRQGKGHVVRRMFADIEADVYLLVDADATYDVPSARRMVQALIDQQLDMVVGCRRSTRDDHAYRPGHRFGNRLLTGAVNLLFGREFTDMLSGYRVFSRRFVKSFPALATGFETETELTVHALQLRMPIAEIDTPYYARPEGSQSKLRTYRDGLRISLAILNLFRKERPLLFFSIAFALLAASSLALAHPIVIEYLETGLVPRFPTAIAATGIMLLAFLSLASGVILDTVTQGRRELKRLIYLSIPALARPVHDSGPA